MPFLGPGQGGRLPQMEPWDGGGHRTPEPDAAWWAPHTILPLPSCTESYKRMAPAFLSSVGIRWAGRSSKGLSPPEGWALPLQIAQTTGGAQLPCPHTARAAREVLGRAEDMHLGLKAAPNTVLDIYTQRAQAGRREGGSSSVPTAFCSKCLTEAISQHRDLEAMPVFTSLFRLTRTEWEKKKKRVSQQARLLAWASWSLHCPLVTGQARTGGPAATGEKPWKSKKPWANTLLTCWAALLFMPQKLL